MTPEQGSIARWVADVMKRHNLNLAGLGKRAGVDATTIGRAADPEFKSITSVKTVVAIAKGVGEPTILDFLAGDHATPKPAMVVPSVESLAALLAAVLPLQPKGRQTAQSLRVVGAALESGLAILGEQIANGEDLALGVASRAAVARFRDLTQQ